MMFGSKKVRFNDMEDDVVLQACNAVDKDRDGILDGDEFKEAMKNLGFADFIEQEPKIFAKFDLGIVRSADGKRRFSRKHTARCTDLPCLGWFFLYWVGMLVIAITAFQNGDPAKLLYGRNWEGNTCGKGDLKDTRLIYYPRMEYDVMNFAKWALIDPDFADPSKFETPGKCVKTCPKEGENFEMGGKKYYVNFNSYVLMGRCFPEYPISPHYFVRCRRYPMRNATTVDDLVNKGCKHYMDTWQPYFGGSLAQNCSAIEDFRSVTCLTRTKPCKSFEDTMNYQPQYCCKQALHAVYPMCVDYVTGKGEYQASPMMQNPVFSKLISAAGTFARWVGDATRAFSYIFLCGVVFTLIQALLWSFLIRHSATVMVKITVTLSIVLPAILSVWLFFKAGVLDGAYVEIQEQYSQKYGSGSGVGLTAEETVKPSPEEEMDSTERDLYLFSAIIVAVLTVAMTIVVILNQKGLQQAAGVISEACKALATMPTAMMWPLVPVMVQTLVLIYWAVVLIYMSTSDQADIVHKQAASLKFGMSKVSNGTLEVMSDNFHLPGTPLNIFTPETNASADLNSTSGGSLFGSVTGGFAVDDNDFFNASSLKYPNITVTASHVVSIFYWYHGFGLLWTCSFIEGIWYCGLSGAICHWYWKSKLHGKTVDKVKRDGRVKEKKTVSKHESRQIALVQLLRVFYEFFIRRFKMVTRNKKMATIRYYINAMRIGLLALQAAMEAVSTQAYIMVVMTGAPFKTAGRAGRDLTGQHTLTIVFVDSLVAANMVLRLAKLCMVVTSTVVMFLLLETDMALPTLGLVGAQKPRITSPTFPLFLVAYLSYVVASAYTDIFSATIKTMILSYATDLELNGQLGNYVMSKEFQSFMGTAEAQYKAAMEFNDEEGEEGGGSDEIATTGGVDLDSVDSVDLEPQADVSERTLKKKKQKASSKLVI